MSTAPEPLALDLLLSEDERRPLTVQAHHDWRKSLGEDEDFDEIDELVEALRAEEFEEKGARP